MRTKKQLRKELERSREFNARMAKEIHELQDKYSKLSKENENLHKEITYYAYLEEYTACANCKHSLWSPTGTYACKKKIDTICENFKERSNGKTN